LIAWLVKSAPTYRVLLAPGGKMIVYGALSTHRQTEADKLAIPIFARSIIYETKIVQGFFPPALVRHRTSRADQGGRWRNIRIGRQRNTSNS